MLVVHHPRTFVIILLIIILLLCIYGVTKHLYLNCRKSEQEAPTALPEQPPIAPVQRVTAPISEPPPPYPAGVALGPESHFLHVTTHYTELLSTKGSGKTRRFHTQLNKWPVTP